MTESVTETAARPIKRGFLALGITLLFAIGSALVRTGLFLFLLPHVGSAAACAVIGLIVLAAGGGFLLRLRKMKQRR